MNLIVFIAVLAISFLVFALLVKVIQTTVKTALTIALIVLLLQFVFGIGPNGFFQQAFQIVQTVWHNVTGGK